jgi:hypothetical protein
MPSGFQLSRDSDLTGYWSGEYWYDTANNPTPFSAHLEDVSGILTGTTLEQVYLSSGGAELSANLTGGRSGSSVYFTKVYQPKRGFRFEPIQYSGGSNDKFTMIEGDWRIATGVSGRFIMYRASFGAKAVALNRKHKIALKR